ncbi:MAG: DEAD/DEAH box helicase [Anaerolineae bacterium]|nr:DEAD/DEAH box helicase [Anaerolineae bacterium]
MGLNDVLQHLRRSPTFMRGVTAWKTLPAREGRYAEFPTALDYRLRDALRARGIERLYTHQAASIAATARGENVVVVTPTASGKTLCYNLPVLHTLLHEANARALYLFPTKALAQDQLHELETFAKALGVGIRAATYDGDTPAGLRRTIRSQAQIVITNPDMLHTGILPHHTKWAALFTGLRYVVVDEVHTYRGVFGSHVANVLRRLKRICAFYGSHPQFICCSATIANPQELVERLVEEQFTLVDNDGAPRAKKPFILYNPPLVNRDLGLRRSPVLEAKRIAGEFLEAGVQTIVFARARLTTEVLLTYLRDEMSKRTPAPEDGATGSVKEVLRGYRGGYLPQQRRAIEQGLRQGTVRGVVATNALELGIDIGELAACVMTGYPGTIASAWQQAGRAGRISEVSAAVLIAGGSPLDQYVVTHPRYFFGRSPEHALVNPDNLAICTAHIQCAAFELPFRAGESFGRFPHTGEVLDFLAEAGVLHRAGGAFHWMHDSYPAEAVSLRTGTSENFVILDVTDGDERAIGEVDVFSAPFLIHEEAIYIHEGQSYQVRALDWEGRIARVQAVNTDYYTTASTSVDVQVLAELERAVDGGATKAHGQVLISAKATSFKKVKLYSHETLGWGEINLPEQTMQTTAYWLSVSDEMIERLRREGIWVADLTGYRGPNWEAQRQRARERDGFRCQHCGAPEKPNRQHDVHHLRPFRKFNYVPGQNEAYLEANRLENLTTLCRSCHLRAEAALMMRSALGGLGHLLRHVAPLHLMCDPRDIGVIVEPRSSFTRRPTITIYEKIPAGVGFSEEMYRLHRTLLKAAHDVAARCPCANGCPACIGPTSEESENAKANTLRLIETLLNSQGATHLQDNIRRQIYGRIPELTPTDKETPAERPDPHPGQRAGAKRCP